MFNIDIYQTLLSNIIFLGLILTMIFYWTSLIFTEKIYILKFAQISGLTCNIILFLYLAWRWYNYKYFPLSNLYESLMFLTCLLLLLYKFFEIKTRSNIIGSLIIPLIILIQGFASLSLPIALQKSSPLVPSLQSNWLMLHVSMMMLSYAMLLLGSLFSLLYLSLNKNENILKQKIKDDNGIEKKEIYSFQMNSNSLFLENNLQIFIKKLNKTNRLSNTNKLLKSLDNWSYRTIGLGFPFLTMGIISGAVWANEAWGSYWSWDPKETWALITWFIFAIYLHIRLTKNFKGEKPAIVGSLGFFVVWICYLGVNFLGKGLHSYGWLS
jgi:cytochrome c-type biogenesis protein CcsB